MSIGVMSSPPCWSITCLKVCKHANDNESKPIFCVLIHCERMHSLILFADQYSYMTLVVHLTTTFKSYPFVVFYLKES
jgi:hypothetical protein